MPILVSRATPEAHDVPDGLRLFPASVKDAVDKSDNIEVWRRILPPSVKEAVDKSDTIEFIEFRFELMPSPERKAMPDAQEGERWW